MGLTLLMPSTSSSNTGAGSVSLPEIFDLLYKVGGSAATAVFGKHTLTYSGNTTGNFVDYLSAAAVKALLEAGVYTTVSVSLVSKGYRVTVAAPTGNLANPTLTPSTSYLLNDGTGTAPNKTSQQNYSAPTSAVAEVFTLDVGGGGDGTITTSNGGSVTCAAGPILLVNSNPSGCSLTSGGLASFAATWTADTPGARADESVASDEPGGGASITVNTQGADGSSEVFGQCVIGFTGAAGYFTFADGFTALVIPITSTGAEIKALLNGADGYNDGGVVETVTVGASSITIDYTPLRSPNGTITIGGRTGAAVVASITGIQNGS